MKKEETKAKKETHFKRLQDLNLMDDFLFHVMTTRKETREEFCRILLKTILKREVGTIRIMSQKAVPGIGTDRHGIRLDLYIEERTEMEHDGGREKDGSEREEGNAAEKKGMWNGVRKSGNGEGGGADGKQEGSAAEKESVRESGHGDSIGEGKEQESGNERVRESGHGDSSGEGEEQESEKERQEDSGNEEEVPEIYDIEVNQYVMEQETLAKRLRFYQSLIDASLLSGGAFYKKLPSVMVILILPYDPFGGGRMVYTIRNRIKEEPLRQYEDGAVKLVLNTKGTMEASEREVSELLHYMQETREENVTNPEIKHLHELVRRIKSDREVSREYMRAWEKEMMIREEGKEEGREEGSEKARRKIAWNMRKEGEPVEKIIRYTQLTEKDVMDLK
ncbi:MAG: Rpn family recombination-promoting nuclease/putative transposase [Eubacteriales bacterium]|nr:Rpn family recombination-promoting nuclease/putative transposase [Eubacteriales bacterium]